MIQRLTLRLLTVSISILFAQVASGAETYQIDPVHSTVYFKVDHLKIAPFQGRFNKIEGVIHIEEKLSKTWVEFRVWPDSIDTHNEKRDRHLRSPDFFNAKQFPIIEFKSKKVTVPKDGTYAIEGNLLMHGKSHPIELSAKKTGAKKDPWGKQRIGFYTETRLSRSQFGMKYMLDQIGDKVDLTISIEAVKQK